MSASCDVNGCGRLKVASGYCMAHYRRWKKHGTPGGADLAPMPPKVCSVEGCPKYVKCAGMCPMHYERFRRTGDAGPALPLVRQPGPATRTEACTVEGCERRRRTRDLCVMHYHRVRKYGEAGAAGSVRNAAGTGNISNGYRWLTIDGKRISEHRAAMQQLLGRPLFKHENVHHINGDRLDNRVDGPLDDKFRSGNLQLWSHHQPPGQSVADKVAYAVEILSTYRPDLLKESEP